MECSDDEGRFSGKVCDTGLLEEGRKVLKKMVVKHFEFVMELVIDGAMIGVFERQLAGSDADYLFFNGLKRSIETGLMTKRETGPQRFWGYVYFNQAQVKEGPIGFAMMCGGGPGQLNEFWMSAIKPEYRNRGMGKLMFGEVLAAERKSNLICRCHKGSEIAMNMLVKNGFVHVGTGDDGTRILIDSRMERKFQDGIRSVM